MPSMFSPRSQWRVPKHFSFSICLLLSTLPLTNLANASGTITISGKPASTVTVGSAYSFTPTLTNTTGKTPSFVIGYKPSWATFDAATGKLSGTPTAANVGKYSNIVIEAYAAGLAAVLPSYSITVQSASGGTTGPTPPPPTGSLSISGQPPTTVVAGTLYSFTPTATIPAGKTPLFAIGAKPSWATFDSKTGKLSGTPTAANVGKYSNILIEVYAGGAAALLPDYMITVLPSGSTTQPSTVKISGTPPTSVVAGNAYRFQPTATDSAGRAVSFSVTNKPNWAAFSISSGLLSGTPTSAQTGSYSNIIVSASDGQSSSALAPFTLSVSGNPAATGSATLGWTNPTQNTNGTSLTNLAGVHIYYGTSQTALTHQLTVASVSQTSTTIGGLTAGTWYFGATAYTTTGMESTLSQIGSKSIQ